MNGLTGRATCAALRDLVELVDGRRESPLESVSAIGLAKLPIAPVPQASLWSLDGEFLGRPDFWWEELGVAGEADGRVKYTDDELWREKQREDRLSRHGVVVVRWGMREAVRRSPMLERVEQGWRRAALLRSAGVSAAVRVSSVGVSFG